MRTRRKFRSVLAVMVGMSAFQVVVLAVEGVGSVLYPAPPGVDLSQPAAASIVATLPVGAKLLVLAAWAVATFAGGWVSARLAGRAPLTHAGVIGGLGLLGAVYTLATIPHPAWMWAVGLAVFPAATYLAARTASPRTRPVPAPAVA